MKTSDEKVIKKGVSLYPEDWQYLQGMATKFGISVSAAIRVTIRDWQRVYLENLEDSAPLVILGPPRTIEEANDVRG